jgi:hypothetical protein
MPQVRVALQGLPPGCEAESSNRYRPVRVTLSWPSRCVLMPAGFAFGSRSQQRTFAFGFFDDCKQPTRVIVLLRSLLQSLPGDSVIRRA